MINFRNKLEEVVNKFYNGSILFFFLFVCNKNRKYATTSNHFTQSHFGLLNIVDDFILHSWVNTNGHYAIESRGRDETNVWFYSQQYRLRCLHSLTKSALLKEVNKKLILAKKKIYIITVEKVQIMMKEIAYKYNNWSSTSVIL